MGQLRKSQSRTAARMGRLFSGFSESGLTVSGYCKRHRVTQAKYYYWRRKLKAVFPAPGDDPQPSFVQVSRLALSNETGYELFLPDGLRLKIPVGFNRESLTTLLSVLSC